MLESNQPFEAKIIVPNYATLLAVYALLAGGSTAAVAAATTTRSPSPVAAPAAEPQPDEPEAEVVNHDAPEIDAHGWPWSADLHASTKGTTKDGLWRMKVGVSRPEPKPGFPRPAVAAEAASAASSASAGDAGTGNANGAAAASAEEDDEFAAFREAAAEPAAPAAAITRSWTDADLSKICNQAATKLGTPEPVKALIAEYVPEGEVAHSRNVPADKREAFAQALEAKGGFTYAA